jgi:hypothetical protein
LSVRKCGSSITNNICRAIAAVNERCFVDVGHTLFMNNFALDDWQRDPALSAIIRPGVIYGGFRVAPIGLLEDPLFVDAPKIVMIRDPRDALVSHYYSIAYSHPIPPPTGAYDEVTKRLLDARKKAAATGVRQFAVANARSLARTFEAYAPVLSMPNVVLAKYEDYILRKPALIDLLAHHFDLKVSEKGVRDILGWADVLPDQENERAFVRQVLPGDHLRKLDRTTIAKLNTILAGPLRRFEYSR